jgi:hypothetical protein
MYAGGEQIAGFGNSFEVGISKHNLHIAYENFYRDYNGQSVGGDTVDGVYRRRR